MSRSDHEPFTASRVDLRRDPLEVARARRIVSQFCGSLPSEVVTIAQLLTSELVTNALEHGSGDVTLSLDCEDGMLRIQVSDGSSRRPLLKRPRVEDDRGRGLLMVESLATAWGVSTALRGGGKTVWFKLRTQSGARLR